MAEGKVSTQVWKNDFIACQGCRATLEASRALKLCMLLKYVPSSCMDQNLPYLYNIQVTLSGLTCF